MDDKRFEDLNARITILEETNKVVVGTVLKDWVRNVASAVLLFFAGEQKADSRKYHLAKGNFLIRLTAYVENTSSDLDKFMKSAAAIISRHNTLMRPSSIDELSTMVNRAKDAIRNNAELRSQVRDEAIIIEDFDSIREHFPNSAPPSKSKINSNYICYAETCDMKLL
jgi:hypothetical protein